MKTVVPAYYNHFKCKADNCVHTCCMGWEIGIDGDTYNLYKESDLSFAKHICEKIICGSDGPQFITDGNKKCPFLHENGLCDIIIKQGEEWLCQICRDHPRFKNYFSDRVEIGLGMCCEEAARLILSENDSSLVILTDEAETFPDQEEKDFFDEREWILECVRSGNTPDDIMKTIQKKYPQTSLGENPSYWYEFLDELECMDKSRYIYFKYMKDCTTFKTGFEKDDIKAFKNILTYYIYRHLPMVFDGYHMQSCLSFCFLCTHIIIHIYLSQSEKTFETLCDIARVFSSEIEYSLENTEAVIDEIDFCIHSSCNF